jgi:hypothetical protein
MYESNQSTLEYLLEDLLERVIKGLDYGIRNKKIIDITEVARDILTQNPHLRERVINNETLTGDSFDTLEPNDLFYYENKNNVWLFSLKELRTLIDENANYDTINNPYTLEPFEKETINSIKRRLQYNKDFLEAKEKEKEKEKERERVVAGLCEHSEHSELQGYFKIGESCDSLLDPNHSNPDNVNMPRNESFNVSHRMTEFLHRVSYLGCYPDINGFKALRWQQIIDFLRNLLNDWPNLLDVLISNDKVLLLQILNRRNLTESGNVRDLLHDDQKAIVKFLTKIVTQNDSNDNSRALLFTTELSSYLTQIEEAGNRDEDSYTETETDFDGDSYSLESETSEAVVSEAVVSEAVVSEAVVSEAVVSEAVVSEAVVSEAVVSDSVRNELTETVRVAQRIGRGAERRGSGAGRGAERRGAGRGSGAGRGTGAGRTRQPTDVAPQETYERMLARLRAQPDNETFVQQVRFIIEHIVEMNTYSLTNSEASNSNFNSQTNSGSSSFIIDDDTGSFFTADEEESE